MNREAVALGTPVYTTFAGRLGAVDEALIREGRLRPLTDAGRAGRTEARSRTRTHASARPAAAARPAALGLRAGPARAGPRTVESGYGPTSRPSTTGATGECAAM